MARPKESMFGLIAGSAALYSANKIRKLGNEFNTLTRSLQIEVQSNQDEIRMNRDAIETSVVAIKTLADLQVATMAGMYELNTELQEISQSNWKLYQFFENRHQEQQRLGDLKLLLRNIRKEVEKIMLISETHPIYATYMAEKLKNNFDAMDVKIEHFKLLSVQEIDWAEEIIQSVGSLYSRLYSSLGD